MFKEKGYDEFLAEKIKRGRADFEAGRFVTLEEHKAKMRVLIERKRLEIEENKRLERETFAYA